MKSRLAIILCLAALLSPPSMTAARAQASSDDALTKIGGSQRDAVLGSQVVAAEQAVEREDWPRALAAWEDLSRHRVDTAPAQLCRLYFDARQGSFDVAKTTDWCRRAAGTGDADGLYRMGLIYLLGFGVTKNVAQAHAFCSAASLRDTHVPAKFCLAAVAREQAKDAVATLADNRNPDLGSAEAGSTTAVKVSARQAGMQQPGTQQIGAQGGTSPRDMCDRSFAPAGTTFDAAAVTRWCGAAADGGDPLALYRMGLMHLYGVGGNPDLDLARSDCAGADKLGQGHVSAAFCLAAVDAERRVTGAAAKGAAPILDPMTGRPLPGTMPDAFAIDRVLDEPHRTATGLDFTCRKLAEWGRFEAPGLTILEPRDALFGKPILAYQRQDFDELGRAANACQAAVATRAYNDGLRQDLDAFRASMTALKKRQAGLRGEQLQASAESGQVASDQVFFAHVNQGRMSGVTLDASFPTTQEKMCVEEIRRGLTGSLLGEQTTLEIHNSSRTEIGANYVVRGEARVDQTAGDWQQARNFGAYSCTFVGHTEKIANSVLLPPPLDPGEVPSLESMDPGFKSKN